MPDDLTLSAISTSIPSNQPAPAVSLAASASAPATSAPFPSPVDHLDAALGIEVLQYLNQNGGIAESFPSQRQLDAYRDQPPVPQPPVHDSGTIA